MSTSNRVAKFLTLLSLMPRWARWGLLIGGVLLVGAALQNWLLIAGAALLIGGVEVATNPQLMSRARNWYKNLLG